MNESALDAQAQDPLGMRARPLRRTKTAVVVAQKLVEEISTNDYQPGTKLPPEREMLQRYSVGRGTLRESLRFLELNGVITVKPGPGGGPTLATPDAHDLASTLGLFLELQHTSFAAILEVRETLEPAIAAMAAVRQDESIIAAVGRSVEQMVEHITDLDLFLRENERFHHLVAAAAGNPVFTLLVGSLDAIADGSKFGISFPITRRKAVAAAHEEIHLALKSGDPEQSAKVMSSHVTAFRRYTAKNHPEAMSSLVRWRDVAP